MHTFLKTILQSLHLYHPLQHAYRRALTEVTKNVYRIRYAAYKGKGYRCNICNSSYSRFVPHYPSAAIREAIERNKVIAGYGDNVFCPNCLSTNRERLVIEVIKEKVPVSNKTILHFSPEKNVYRFLKDKALVTTADLTPAFYTPIDPGIRHADATQLDFSDGAFELVVANHILEHIPDDRKAMRELYRVLKNGGVAILQVPYSDTLPATIEAPSINAPRRQEQLFGQKDHVRIYTFSDYVDRLRHAGFEVVVLPPEELKHLSRFAIQEGESFFLCYKRG